jgi:hypothetical protein
MLPEIFNRVSVSIEDLHHVAWKISIRQKKCDCKCAHLFIGQEIHVDRHNELSINISGKRLQLGGDISLFSLHIVDRFGELDLESTLFSKINTEGESLSRDKNEHFLQYFARESM